MSTECSVCGDCVDCIKGGAWEEGSGDFWCLVCMLVWENRNGQDWATGAPKESAAIRASLQNKLS